MPEHAAASPRTASSTILRARAPASRRCDGNDGSTSAAAGSGSSATATPAAGTDGTRATRQSSTARVGTRRSAGAPAGAPCRETRRPVDVAPAHVQLGERGANRSGPPWSRQRRERGDRVRLAEDLFGDLLDGEGQDRMGPDLDEESGPVAEQRLERAARTARSGAGCGTSARRPSPRCRRRAGDRRVDGTPAARGATGASPSSTSSRTASTWASAPAYRRPRSGAPGRRRPRSPAAELVDRSGSPETTSDAGPLIAATVIRPEGRAPAARTRRRQRHRHHPARARDAARAPGCAPRRCGRRPRATARRRCARRRSRPASARPPRPARRRTPATAAPATPSSRTAPAGRPRSAPATALPGRAAQHAVERRSPTCGASASSHARMCSAKTGRALQQLDAPSPPTARPDRGTRTRAAAPARRRRRPRPRCARRAAVGESPQPVEQLLAASSPSTTARWSRAPRGSSRASTRRPRRRGASSPSSRSARRRALLAQRGVAPGREQRRHGADRSGALAAPVGAAAARAAASSTTWQLVPPMPNELTPATVGRRLGPRLGLVWHAQAELVERDVRVRLLEVQARRDLAVLDAQRRLDQPGDARPRPPGGPTLVLAEPTRSGRRRPGPRRAPRPARPPRRGRRAACRCRAARRTATPPARPRRAR